MPLAASAQAEDQQIQGTVQSINSTFNITVLDSNGNLDNVELHQGTVINPTGLTLAPGMNVTVDGYDDGGQFDANVIQTPYQYSGPAPVPVYYGAGWWYPGFAYGYGPSFSLFIGTGGGPWVSRQPWGGHWWVNTPVHTFVGVRGGGGYGGGRTLPGSFALRRSGSRYQGNYGCSGIPLRRHAALRLHRAARTLHRAAILCTAQHYSAPRSYSAPRGTLRRRRILGARAVHRPRTIAHPARSSGGGGYRGGGGSGGRHR